MANRQDFKRLEDVGKAGVFVGVLAAGAALGKGILKIIQQQTGEEIKKSNIENYDRQGWFYKLTHKRPE